MALAGLEEPYADDTDPLLASYRLSMERRGLLASSIEKRCLVLRVFARHCAPQSLLEATRQDIEEFLDSRRGKTGHSITSRTRHVYLSHLGCFYGWAVMEELLERDPTLRIMRPKLRRTLPRPIGDEDLALAIAEAPPDLAAMIALGAYQGLRCQEIAGLCREDVLDGRDPPVIVVVKGKGGHQRVLPLHPEALAALRRLPMPRSGPVITRRRGGAHIARSVSQAIGAYFRELGITASAHQLRHWFGTSIYAVSRDIRLTQELMGHSSPNTTAGYVAWAAVDAAPAVAALRITDA